MQIYVLTKVLEVSAISSSISSFQFLSPFGAPKCKYYLLILPYSSAKLCPIFNFSIYFSDWIICWCVSRFMDFSFSHLFCWTPLVNFSFCCCIFSSKISFYSFCTEDFDLPLTPVFTFPLCRMITSLESLIIPSGNLKTDFVHASSLALLMYAKNFGLLPG